MAKRLKAVSTFRKAHDETLLQKIADAALRDSAVCCGMQVTEIRSQRTPDFGAGEKNSAGFGMVEVKGK
jgi:hypothetical protein